MKAAVNFISGNAVGNQNDNVTFNTIKELKKYLNEALYYCDEVVLFNHRAAIEVNYSEITDLKTLIADCNLYNEVLNVIQIFN